MNSSRAIFNKYLLERSELVLLALTDSQLLTLNSLVNLILSISTD